MWQVVLLFLFAGTLAWLVASSVRIIPPPVQDEDWEGFQRDLEWDRRR
jgi:hypothetical protein